MRVKVSEIMTREVTSVDGATPFKDVAEVLIAHGVSAVPVVDAGNHVIGVVSEADLLHKEEFKEQYYREGYQPPLRARLRHRLAQEQDRGRAKAHGDTAAELMTSPAVTVRPQSAIVYAIRLMDEHGVKRLPVVDENGVLQGIVSRQDLLKVFLRSDAAITEEIRRDILDRSVWTDTSQVKVLVHRGVVTLTGRMEQRSEAQLTAHMALRVNGVVDVVDEIRWDEDGSPA
ncbi:CBS domain-containing protein [Streptosporangium sp. NPDC000239]|uniref:CBS domain-containing protein n=1 Tax=Streptosporangium jomthongense TaxID=1193683 RepID=A0ABV8F778_9ACTN